MLTHTHMLHILSVAAGEDVNNPYFPNEVIHPLLITPWPLQQLSAEAICQPLSIVK